MGALTWPGNRLPQWNKVIVACGISDGSHNAFANLPRQRPAEYHGQRR